MTDSASAMLSVLKSLTSETIYVCKDVTPSTVANRSILILTTEKYAKSLWDTSDSNRIWTLESAVGSKIENLLIQLADEIIHDYRSEALLHHKLNQVKQANQLEDKANQIHHKILLILKKVTTSTLSQQQLDSIDYSLVILTLNNNDIQTIKDDFQDFFLSYYFFSNKHPCHEHIVEHEQCAEIFLIILSDHSSTIVDQFHQFSNVKYVYYLGQTTDKGKRIFSNRKSLEYKLILDLLGYYAELGDRYQLNEQRQRAREVFLKGQRLSQFLCERFFAKN